MLCKIGVLKNFAKFTIKQLCRSDFFNKLLPRGRPFYRTPAVIAFVGTLLQNKLTQLIKDDYESHMMTLREECPYLEFFWSVFSRIRTEKLRTRKTLNTDTFHPVWVMPKKWLSKKTLFIQISQGRVRAKTNAILWWKMPSMSFLVLWGIIFVDLHLVLEMIKSIQIGFLGMDHFL